MHGVPPLLRSIVAFTSTRGLTSPPDQSARWELPGCGPGTPFLIMKLLPFSLSLFPTLGVTVTTRKRAILRFSEERIYRSWLRALHAVGISSMLVFYKVRSQTELSLSLGSHVYKTVGNLSQTLNFSKCECYMRWCMQSCWHSLDLPPKYLTGPCTLFLWMTGSYTRTVYMTTHHHMIAFPFHWRNVRLFLLLLTGLAYLLPLSSLLLLRWRPPILWFLPPGTGWPSFPPSEITFIHSVFIDGWISSVTGDNTPAVALTLHEVPVRSQKDTVMTSRAFCPCVYPQTLQKHPEPTSGTSPFRKPVWPLSLSFSLSSNFSSHSFLKS